MSAGQLHVVVPRLHRARLSPPGTKVLSHTSTSKPPSQAAVKKPTLVTKLRLLKSLVSFGAQIQATACGRARKPDGGITVKCQHLDTEFCYSSVLFEELARLYLLLNTKVC